MSEHGVTETGPRDGPAVVWLGSLGSTAAMWEPQLAMFGGRTRNVFVDHPGHGGRPSPTGPVTIESMADGVATELDRLGIGRAHVVGTSIGAMVAMALAVHHGAGLDRLALLCTSAQLGPAAAWHERAATVRADGTGAIAAVVVGRWLTPDYAEDHPGQVADLVAMVSGVEREGYAACCEAIATMDLRAVLPQVTAPTLVVAGALDPATPVEHGELIAALIPQARVEIVEAAHLANWELPDRVNTLLADHLLGQR